MTTTHACIVAFALVIVWAIVMWLLLRWAQANAALQAARRKVEQQEAAERARVAAYWASPEGRERKAQMDAEQRSWEWERANAAQARPPHMDDIRDVVMGVRIRRPAAPVVVPYQTAPTPVYVAPPAYTPRPVEQPARTRPAAPAAVPVEQPIAVPDWPVPVRQRKEAQP